MFLIDEFIFRMIKSNLIFVLTASFILSCNFKNDKKTIQHSKSINLNPSTEITNEEFEKINGERNYRDSSTYSIIEGNYQTGEKYLLVYCNKDTKLDLWKEFYPNGKLKVEGSMTTSNHIYVGKWKYYSET